MKAPFFFENSSRKLPDREIRQLIGNSGTLHREPKAPRSMPEYDMTPQWVKKDLKPIVHSQVVEEIQQDFMIGKGAQQRQELGGKRALPTPIQFGSTKLKAIPTPESQSMWYNGMGDVPQFEEPKAYVAAPYEGAQEEDSEPEVEVKSVDLQLYTLLQDGQLVISTNSLDELEKIIEDLAMNGVELDRLTALKQLPIRAGIFCLGEHVR